MSEQHKDFYETHAEQITEGELHHLLQHEPGLKFEILQGSELSQGRQSRVSIIEYERGDETFQVLWKRMGVGKDLTEDEAEGFRLSLEPYRQKLLQAGWKVPRLLHNQVCNMGNEFQIFSYEQFIAGGDGEKMYADKTEPNFRRWSAIDQIVTTLAQYDQRQTRRIDLAGKQLTQLSDGLDLKLANFVLQPHTDDLYFVDLFGPKEIDENGTWVNYSSKLDTLGEESLMAVCGTREGAILRCWRLAEQMWPESVSDIDAIRSTFKQKLVHSGLPAQEVVFISDEIEHNFPWLDRIYQENKV